MTKTVVVFVAVSLVLCSFAATASYAASMSGSDDGAMTVDCTDRTSPSVPDTIATVIGTYVAAVPLLLPVQQPAMVALIILPEDPLGTSAAPLRL